MTALLRRRVLVSAFAVSAVTLGCSATDRAEEPVARARQAIQGGAVDDAHRFAVGLVAAFGSDVASYCSGTLITPNLVVTARHCVDDVPHTIDCDKDQFGGPFLELDEMRVSTNTDVIASGASGPGVYRVKEIVRPEENAPCGADIAFLVLDTLVPSVDAVPVTPGIKVVMSQSPFTGKYAAIGYGITSPDSDDTGTRRILADLDVQCIPNVPGHECPVDFTPSPREFVGDDGVCPGDSGSGAFDATSLAGGNPVTFGVLSRGGDNVDGTMCALSAYTRLDAWPRLTVLAAERASSQWMLYSQPDWAVGITPGQDGRGEVVGGPDASVPPGPKSEHGGPCTTSDDCRDGVCLAGGSTGGFCARSCGEASGGSTCPAGTVCTSGACLPKPTGTQGANVLTVRTEHACSVAAPGAPTPRTPGSATLALAVGALLLGRRRRR